MPDRRNSSLRRLASQSHGRSCFGCDQACSLDCHWLSRVALLGRRRPRGHCRVPRHLLRRALRRRPPDREHRFGHGKGEAIAGFTQAAFLAGAALALAFQSAERLVFREPIKQFGLGFGVIAASLLITAGLVAMQTWVVRHTGSTAIAADRAHYLTGVAVNLAVLAALGVTRFTGWDRADPAFALAICGYMLWNSYGITADVLKQLLDRELPRKERQRIRDKVLSCPDVRDLHDLRTRYSGDRTFVEFHLEVDGHLTIAEGHAISDAVEVAVEQLFSTVHR